MAVEGGSRIPSNDNGSKWVVAWWHEAELAARSERLPRARRYLRWILACCPDDVDAWLWLAELASGSAEQLTYLRQAYALHPNDGRVQFALRQARNQQLESAVGELRPGQAVLHCLPDKRR